jgi:hypothetical protein
MVALEDVGATAFVAGDCAVFGDIIRAWHSCVSRRLASSVWYLHNALLIGHGQGRRFVGGGARGGGGRRRRRRRSGRGSRGSGLGARLRRSPVDVHCRFYSVRNLKIGIVAVVVAVDHRLASKCGGGGRSDEGTIGVLPIVLRMTLIVVSADFVLLAAEEVCAADTSLVGVSADYEEAIWEESMDHLDDKE